MIGRPMLFALPLAALLSTVTAATSSAVAAAAEAGTAAQELQARAHFAAGQDEYARGRWREALREFEAGYALSPRPEFLINFAQAHRKLGEYDAAARECRRYLATSPPPGLAAQAQRLLEQIEDERAHAPPTPAPSTPATLPTSPPTSASPTSPRTSAPSTNAPRTSPPSAQASARSDGNALVAASTPPSPAATHKRRAWIAPVVVAGVLVVAAAVTVGLVLGLPANDTFKPTPLGTVDFR